VRAVVIPDPAAGYCNDSTLGAERARAVDGLRLNNCGISLIQRSVEAVFADLFASVSGSRPHVISIWGPAGSGRTTAALHVARVARLNGFMPVGLQILRRIDSTLVKDRHLCVISDQDGDTEWATLLSIALAS